jgi:shikimate kinase
MNITLIGMAGVGKSVIGKELAQRLDYEFIDVDEVIEKKIKLKLQQIIDNFKEDRFLEIEEKTILELGELNNCIISPGGSVAYSVEAMKFLKKNSVIVFLKAPFESIQKRLTNQETRGIIGLKKGLKTLFDERLILYKEYADVTIDMPDDFSEVAENIIQKIFYK